MMILLNGHSLAVSDKFQPERLSVNLSERQSTATMTLPSGSPVLSVDDWVQDESGPAAGIVWRVKTIDEQYDRKTRTITLEHVIQTLKDQLMFGEIKSSDISGSSANPTAKQAVEYILARQSDWTLGDFDYTSVSNPYSFNGDDLFSAMETVSSSLEDCIWEYDFSAYPFTLHIRQMNSTICSEMRSDRNIRTLKKTIDRSRMYTRIYPIGKNNLKLDSSYLSKNENLYGVISHTETDQSQNTKAKLQAWAQERLDRHCEPAVTVTISGLELEEVTGEPLDSFTIGRMCRVPLPEFSTTITERVTKLAYSDIVNDPLSVTVTLANEVQDVASILKQQSASSGRAGRAQALEDEEDHAWIVDTKDKVALVAEAVAGKDGDEPDWSRVSELTVDGNGIDARVTHAEGDIVDAFASIRMTESSIRSDVSAAQSTLYSYIQQTASSINIRVAEKKRTWIQDTDPRNSGITPSEGDIWVESTHQGTWDGAEGFDWEHDEDYDWTQIQGAKIWGWANDKWELVSDQQQVVTITDVETTSEHFVARALKALVNDEGNLSVYRAELLVEGDRIRSEVHAATSEMYSFILQTASQITIRVGESNMVFSGTTQPTGTADHPLVDGDLWLETNFQRIWADQEELDSWIDDEDFDWSDMKGSKVHVYDATLGAFREVLDEQVLAQDTDIDETSEKISLVARSLKAVDGKVDVYRAEFKVTSDQIKSSVNQRLADVGSTITQTAREIRAEVHAASSTIYSSISQTASQIRAEVADTANGLNSVIMQTASQIRTEVNAANSTIYSSITQTASQIRAEVASTASSLSSSITQTASAIRSEVNAAKSSIYSSITQTASAIRSEVANSVSGLQSSITQTANTIDAVVTGSGSGAKLKTASVKVAIEEATGSSKIHLSADNIILDGDTVASVLSGKHIEANFLGAADVQVGSELYVDGSAIIKYEYGSSYDMENMIVGASASGNTLTLTKLNGDEVTFSKATTLTPSWSGKTFTVTAKQNGETIGTSSVSPDVHPVSSQGAAYTDIYLATYDGSNWTNHGDAVRLTMSNAGGRVDLKNASGSVFAQLSVPVSRTDKGSNWYCTIEQSGSTKNCRLSKSFSASQSIPFNNGSSYHLYT